MSINKDLAIILHAQTGAQDLEICWMEGYHFGQNEQKETTNPYRSKSL